MMMMKKRREDGWKGSVCSSYCALVGWVKEGLFARGLSEWYRLLFLSEFGLCMYVL